MQRLLVIIISILLSSCGFGHLTDINNQDTTAPTAKECGGCHVDQYAEWQQTSHANAFKSKQFKQQSDHYKDQDCLFCHVPGDVQDPKRASRNYNQDEGVTCVSCHLHNNSMQGPHESGALVSPHSIAQSNTLNSKIDSPKLCGTCHKETYEQWLKQQKTTPLPTCHACHGAPVTRTHTKGTNLFSDILVTFESRHEVRSHHLMLPGQINPEVAPRVLLNSDHHNEINITITNTLPHDLPTGSFGEKQIMIQAHRLQGDHILETKTQPVPETLNPGQSITITLSLARGDISKHIQINLLRFHQSTTESTLIRTYHFLQE